MNPLIIIILLVAIGVGVYFYMEQEKKKKKDTGTQPTVAATVAAPTAAASVEAAPAKASGAVPMDGLIGWWDGPSYDDSQRVWKDKSGAGNNLTEISGLLQKSKNGEEVQGDVDAVVAFPEEMLSGEGYTLVVLAKYNGDNKGRIFTTTGGDEGNFVFGHHNGKAGVYHVPDEAWVTENRDHHGDDWTLSVIQPTLYRSNGALRTGYRNPLGEDRGEVPLRFTINGFTGEKSDWAVKEILIYDRNLTAEEYLAVEKILMEKYDVKPNRYDTSALTGVVTGEEWPEITRDLQFRCGKGEALTEFGVDADMKSKYMCMSGMDVAGEEIMGQTIFEEVNEDSEYFKNLQNKKIDCGERPINSLYLAMDENEEKIRYEYTCNNSEVKKNTCESVSSDAYAIGTSFGNITSLTNTKCPAEHVITSAKLVVDPEDATKQKWELTCCKPKGI